MNAPRRSDRDETRSAHEGEPAERPYPLLVRAGIFLAGGAACWALVLWLARAVS